MTKCSVLIVGSDPETSRVIAGSLSDREFDVAVAPTATQARDLVSSSSFDLAIVFEPLVKKGANPGILRILREASPTTEIIISATRPTVESAFLGIQESVYDYLCLPSDLDRLPLTARKAVFAHRQRVKHGDANGAPLAHCASVLIGDSPAIAAIRENIVAWAAEDAPVWVSGEAGTGKDLVARLLHEVSARHGMGPFARVSCDTIPEADVELEFFGHVRGASSGPVPQKPGRFELADGGTLYLDRIDTFRFEVQSRILETLRDREFTRLGGNTVFRMTAQVIASTTNSTGDTLQPDFRAHVAAHAVVLPPLRERKDDIPLLCAHFMKTIAVKHGLPPKQVPPHILDRLVQYAWPENVRELEMVVTRFALNGKSSG